MNIDAIVSELDRLYEFEMDKYISECEYWKSKGYKILRNSKGEHKVVEPIKSRPIDFKNDFFGLFGDIFTQ